MLQFWEVGQQFSESTWNVLFSDMLNWIKIIYLIKISDNIYLIKFVVWEKGFSKIFPFSVDNFLHYLALCGTSCFGTAVGSGDIEVVVTSTLVRLYVNVMCQVQLKVYTSFKERSRLHYIICIVLSCPSPSNGLYCDHQGHYFAI